MTNLIKSASKVIPKTNRVLSFDISLSHIFEMNENEMSNEKMITGVRFDVCTSYVSCTRNGKNAKAEKSEKIFLPFTLLVLGPKNFIRHLNSLDLSTLSLFLNITIISIFFI